ncbi:GNAT superfamily N-acetyltransferase [Methylobacterium sp. RAS18]|nr:GNAT superfamily N-acetyltransferase [Methylobacterium sp. RAS18]
MLVRLALDTERDTVVDLCVAAVEESVRGIAPERARIEATFQAYLDSADPTFFVVEQKREIVGFLMATIGGYTYASGIYTTQQVMYVRPDKRGTRAATLLIRHLEDWSRRLGAREITGGNNNGLYTERTARFLEKQGFERTGVFMRKSLGV